MIRILGLLIGCTATLSVLADDFDGFRKYIDNYEAYSHEQRESSIQQLERMKSSNVEKNYLLGMLYFLQGVDSINLIAQSKKEKLNVNEVINETQVHEYFVKSQQQYEIVEKAHPGYKFIYCKFAELYRFSFNAEGLRQVTSRAGQVKQEENVTQCKNSLEDIAEGFAQRGYLKLSQSIYEEAIKTWKPYPKYMLEALGDIEKTHNDLVRAKSWWKRCIDEADSSGKKRCAEKIGAEN